MRKQLLVVIILLFTVGGVFGQTDEIIRQWASDAQATSEYAIDDYSAMQATGEPDVLRCEDSPQAWASATVSKDESLTVMFDRPVYPAQLNIHQNYSPGAIVSVELIVAQGESNIPLKESADTDPAKCPGTFSLNIVDIDVPVIGAVIHLDQTLVGDWNEIDAVELVGIAAEVEGDIQDEAADYTFNGPYGMTVTCDDGRSFDNGVEISIEMRTGFTYTATALGVGEFDPILAVLGEDGTGLCTDDDVNAALYSASLPTIGVIEPASTHSQVPFANNSSESFHRVSLVVGGFENQTGEFILILEGMALTAADGIGDPFSLQITPGMIASGVAPTAYMISVTDTFDPLIALIDSEFEYLLDDNGNYFSCDDAGNPEYCWGESYDLSDSYISRTNNRQLPGGPYDAMLTLPVEAGMENLYFNYVMSSPAADILGDYIVVFHVGIGQ